MATCNIDLAAYEATRDAVTEDPEKAKGEFSTTTEWIDGARAKTTARSFTIETDEPAPLGGTDQHVDPMELILAAVGTCLQIGWTTQAEKRGLELKSLRIDVTGDFDLRGYLGVDETVRPGFQGIRYDVAVDIDATEEELAEIKAAVEATSPMFDNTRNVTPLQGEVTVAQAA